MLDGNARLNLATFVTTWMEPEAEKLMAETFDKNMIDKDEYPQTAEIEHRCVNIVSRLFHAPDEGRGRLDDRLQRGGDAGRAWPSSGAGATAGERKGKPTDKPNLVMGTNVQVVWEKFCRYWDVEPRYLPMERGRYVITPEQVRGRRRREHHRRGGRSWAPPTPASSSPSRRSTTRWCDSNAKTGLRDADPRRRAPAAASSRRSCTPTWSGTSACRW